MTNNMRCYVADIAAQTPSETDKGLLELATKEYELRMQYCELKIDYMEMKKD